MVGNRGNLPDIHLPGSKVTSFIYNVNSNTFVSDFRSSVYSVKLMKCEVASIMFDLKQSHIMFDLKQKHKIIIHHIVHMMSCYSSYPR